MLCSLADCLAGLKSLGGCACSVGALQFGFCSLICSLADLAASGKPAVLKLWLARWARAVVLQPCSVGALAAWQCCNLARALQFSRLAWKALQCWSWPYSVGTLQVGNVATLPGPCSVADLLGKSCSVGAGPTVLEPCGLAILQPCQVCSLAPLLGQCFGRLVGVAVLQSLAVLELKPCQVCFATKACSACSLADLLCQVCSLAALLGQCLGNSEASGCQGLQFCKALQCCSPGRCAMCSRP